jgi:hypothetical protein
MFVHPAGASDARGKAAAATPIGRPGVLYAKNRYLHHLHNQTCERLRGDVPGLR